MIINVLLFLFFCVNGMCGVFDDDLQHAKAIVNSRIDFYEIRGGLLSGTDETSRQFQEAICNQEGTSVQFTPSILVPGVGDNLFQMIRDIALNKVPNSASFLTNAQHTNRTCKQEWELVLNKLMSIERDGTKNVTIADFNALMEHNFSRRGMVEGIAHVIKTSETVSKDLNSIASDLGDFRQVSALLEPYLLEPGISLSKLRKGGERLKREFLEKKDAALMLKHLSEGDDLDALAAYITGEASAAKPSRKSSKRKNKVRDVVGSETSELCATAVISPVIDASFFPVITEVVVEHNQPVINAAGDSLLIGERMEEKEDNSVTSTVTDSVVNGDVEEDFDFTPNYFNYVTQKSSTTNNSKLARQRDKEAGLAAKVSADTPAVKKSEVGRSSLALKPPHISILQSILSVTSHPPKWRKALSAISSVISQLGGSFTGSLGRGSSVEFWIGSVRFLVDSSHGSDREMMYPDQMVFMKKGLERAGITLDLLRGL